MDIYFGDLEHVTLSVLFRCTSISIFQLLCSLIKRKLIFIWLPFCLLNTANAVSEGGWWCDVSMASFIFSLILGSFRNASCPWPCLASLSVSKDYWSQISQVCETEEAEIWGKNNLSQALKLQKAVSIGFHPCSAGLPPSLVLIYPKYSAECLLLLMDQLMGVGPRGVSRAPGWEELPFLS